MKRIFAALICVLMFTAMLLPVMAEDDNFLGEIGEIPCPYGTPTVDGTIDAAEGWSTAQYIDKTNTDGAWGGEEVVITGNIYRAYDDTNLYIAADINIPELSLSEDLDWIEGDETGNKPGWDGDVFVYTLDPLGEFVNLGFASDVGVWYCFGIFEGNIVRAYRTHVNDGEVSDVVKSAGAVTETGWRLEAAIPWETICKDVEDISYGDIVFTPADLAKAGNKISGEMIYYDRVYDPEATERITGSRYATICTTCADGTPGPSATPWMLKCYGMHFILGEKPVADDTTVVPDTTTVAPGGSNADPENTTTSAATEAVTEVVTDDKGNAVTDNKGNKVTQKVTQKATQKATAKATTKKATTGTSTSAATNAAQTFDIGVAMAIGALAVSGIGFVKTKKRQ